MFAASADTPIRVFVFTAPPPLPIDIGSVPVPRIIKSAFSMLTLPLNTALSFVSTPTVRSSLSIKSWLIVVSPVEAPMTMLAAAPPNNILVAPVLTKLNPADDVVIPVKIVGLVWNTNLSNPVVSVIKPRICVDVVDENDARVSDLYATSPPTLKLTATVAAGLSDVNVRESFISNILDVAMSIVADAVVLTISPLIDVAVAAPILGAVSVGDVRVLLVRICVSDSVTNLLSTEPSHPLQYPPELYHCIA